MLFLVIEHWAPGRAVDVYRRFRDRGRLAPEGVRYVSSWVDLEFRRCFQVMEAENEAHLEKWTAHWEDLVEFEIIPVRTSDEAAKAIAPALAAAVFPLTDAGSGRAADADSDHVAAAKRYLRGVYGGDASVVQELASEDIVTSYPIFARLFGTPALRGREAVTEFATRFGQRWKDARVEFHETVEERDRVVLVWSFEALRVPPDGQAPADELHRWGGITLVRFDREGRITAEIGEESDPGPMRRLASSDAD